MVARLVAAPRYRPVHISVRPGRLVKHPVSLFAAEFFPIFAVPVPDRSRATSPWQCMEDPHVKAAVNELSGGRESVD